jgi:UDP-glucose 4-epimerase
MTHLNCLVTGANGFVGAALVKRLHEIKRFSLRAAVRNGRPPDFPDVPVHAGLALSAGTDWRPALSAVDCVIHTAARVHVMDDTAADPLAAFRQTNVDGTLNLARQSAAAGVRRFIFISSIKVNGESSEPGRPCTAEDRPAAADPYGISKAEAESALRQLAASTGMEVVIIRPPLVYGPGVKANFLSLMRWLGKGLPLPFGAIDNQRSLVALGNLVDLLVTCIDHPAAANQTFLVSDDEALSTTELLRRMGEALGRPARLWPVPVWLLTRGAALAGQRALSQRLCGSLQVDIAKTKNLLAWSPPLTVNEGLRIAARHFLDTEGRQ